MKGLVPKNGKLTLTNELAKPVAGDGEVLVKVVSSSLNPGDPAIGSGALDEFLPEAALNFPVRTGLELSGVVVESSGPFKKGDEVYSYVDVFEGQKGHQDYAALAWDCVAPKPKTMDFDEAATVPTAALTVLGGLRDVADLKSGENC